MNYNIIMIYYNIIFFIKYNFFYKTYLYFINIKKHIYYTSILEKTYKLSSSYLRFALKKKNKKYKIWYKNNFILDFFRRIILILKNNRKFIQWLFLKNKAKQHKISSLIIILIKFKKKKV